MTTPRSLGQPRGIAYLLLCLFLLYGCQSSSGPEAVLYGEDACHECKMTISDPRFGGELRTRTGKVLKFDSLDCMIPFLRTHREEIAESWVVDSFRPNTLISASSATYIRVSGLHSPMGLGVLSSRDPAALAQSGGDTSLLNWEQVQQLYP
jgi:copper chaperone NosL